jgi:hypothetical protein
MRTLNVEDGAAVFDMLSAETGIKKLLLGTGVPNFYREKIRKIVALCMDRYPVGLGPHVTLLGYEGPTRGTSQCATLST